MSYDPFATGPFEVVSRTFEAHDTTRDRRLPCEVWLPAQPGTRPVVVYSHHSGGNRRSASFLCGHLSSHGYVVAAVDHVAPAVDGDLDERRKATIASRVPDVRFLIDQVLSWPLDGTVPDPDRIGAVGHSFGGWTVLSLPDVDDRVRAVVALAPGGSSNPRPGILRAPLGFGWRREVPVLYLVAEDDVALPLSGMVELFERTPSARRMVSLLRADHNHFIDDVEAEHEAFRTADLPEELAYVTAEMRPYAELVPAEQAHLFTRGLTLAHFDATLRGNTGAERLLDGDVEATLARHGVAVIAGTARTPPA
jgi:dienelactone hydrolase